MPPLERGDAPIGEPDEFCESSLGERSSPAREREPGWIEHRLDPFDRDVDPRQPVVVFRKKRHRLRERHRGGEDALLPGDDVALLTDGRWTRELEASLVGFGP